MSYLHVGLVQFNLTNIHIFVGFVLKFNNDKHIIACRLKKYDSWIIQFDMWFDDAIMLSQNIGWNLKLSNIDIFAYIALFLNFDM